MKLYDFEVYVQSTSSGRSYKITLKAGNEIDAKRKALEQANKDYPEFEWDKAHIL